MAHQTNQKKAKINKITDENGAIIILANTLRKLYILPKGHILYHTGKSRQIG